MERNEPIQLHHEYKWHGESTDKLKQILHSLGMHFVNKVDLHAGRTSIYDEGDGAYHAATVAQEQTGIAGELACYLILLREVREGDGFITKSIGC